MRARLALQGGNFAGTTVEGMDLVGAWQFETDDAGCDVVDVGCASGKGDLQVANPVAIGAFGVGFEDWQVAAGATLFVFRKWAGINSDLGYLRCLGGGLREVGRGKWVLAGFGNMFTFALDEAGVIADCLRFGGV